MIYTYSELIDKYSNYAAPKMKIKSLVDHGNLFAIRPGLYTDDKNISKLALSHIIYGPSYISFETALSYYGLIPERAVNVLSATTHKNRKKHFQNIFGDYFYRDVPFDVFSYGIDVERDKYGNIIRIAKVEKALLDTLYTVKNVRSEKQLRELLFDDLRINDNLFEELDANFIFEVGPKYKKKNIDYLIKMLEKDYVQ